jgi:hypothetical protein
MSKRQRPSRFQDRRLLGGAAAWYWLVITAMIASPASAAQFLINPGDDWATKASKARPGDEIILLPGRHRGATFDRLAGTPEAPITIRGASVQKPAIIAAQLDGIRVKQGAHLIIKDLQITGGSASGIWISGAQPGSPPERSRNILINNVAISKIGPRGQRHGVFLSALNDVRILGLRVEGWGGSAIEITACNDVSITTSTFRGLEDHTQFCGVRARAGAERISITDCRFDNAGDFVICMGGKSSPDDFVPPVAPEAPTASIPEVANMQVDRCKIIGGMCPLALIHAEHCALRASTIVRPHRCVIAVLNESPDVRVKPSARNTFGYNLTVWQSGDLTRLAEIADGANDAVALEDNLWWSNETPEDRAKLGPLPGKDPLRQVFDVDPKLNEGFKPSEPAAQAYGAG